MLIKTDRTNRSPGIRSSEITPAGVYTNRRELLRVAGLSSAAALLPGIAAADEVPASYRRLANIGSSSFSTGADPTPFEDVISYNNFYEFGTGKTDPAEYSGSFKRYG